MKILNKPTTNIEQMKAWAISKKAYEFEKLAESCYNASLKTGVDPTVSYALSALETGWCYKNGSSQAGINASYHNPAGLKVTKGGSDYNPNAHMKFKSWEEGYIAQQQHLALYAGKEDYPLSNPLDPRHFAYLFGRAKSVEELGGKNKWNSNPQYGYNVLKLANELLSTKHKEETTVQQRGDVTLETLILYDGDIDAISALMLSQKLKCPLMKKSDYHGTFEAKKILYVGGAADDTDRFQTFKNVAKIL